NRRTHSVIHPWSSSTKKFCQKAALLPGSVYLVRLIAQPVMQQSQHGAVVGSPEFLFHPIRILSPAHRDLQYLLRRFADAIQTRRSAGDDRPRSDLIAEEIGADLRLDDLKQLPDPGRRDLVDRLAGNLAVPDRQVTIQPNFLRFVSRLHDRAGMFHLDAFRL